MLIRDRIVRLMDLFQENPVMDDEALTELALRAGSGDRDAATEFIRHTYQQVWRVLVVLSDRGVAEDLAQETYARAVRSLPSFKAQAPARAWLLSIARRVAADNLRTAARRPRTESRTELDPAMVVTRDESETVALRALIQHLDPDRRLAFELTQLLGLSYAEAAEACGCPVGTVRSRVARERSDVALALDARDDVVTLSAQRSGEVPRSGCGSMAVEPRVQRVRPG